MLKEINKIEEEKGVSPFTSFYNNYKYEPICTYKIIPDYTVDNANNDTIAHAIASMYLSPRQRLNVRGLSYVKPIRAYFDLVLRHNKANFYMTTHDNYSELLEGKMKTIWNKSQIDRVRTTELNTMDKMHTEVCELVLKDFNFKSLNVDKRNLYPLTNMMGVLKCLNDDEQVRVHIVFEPIKRKNWIDTAKDEFKAYENGKVINNEMSKREKAVKLGFTGAEALLELYIQYKLLIFESVFGIILPEKKEEEKIPFELKIPSIEAIREEIKFKGLTPSSTYKLTSETFRARLVVLSESNDKNRARINMLAVANSYKDLTENNELCIRGLSKKDQEKMFKDVMEFTVATSKDCVLSDKEVAKLIQLPQKDLQNEYCIEAIDNREMDVPEQLQGGTVRIGIAQKQGKEVVATWSKDKNIMALAKVFMGPQNVGKTTGIKRTVKDCYKAGYSNITIDFIENCDTAREIAEVIPDADKVVIRLGERDFIPSLAYNEVSRMITEDMDKWERVRLANLIAEQVEYFIDAVTDASTGQLTAPMLRYLHSACMLVFIKPNAKINDVFTILRRWDKRNEAIRYAKYSECFDADDDVFFDMEELHKRDGDGKIVGTNDNLIVGILNRITVLQKNPYIKAMLRAEIDMEQDLTRYIEEGKSVFIEIPQTKFPNIMVRDILTTFFISRIWLMAQMRENNRDARLCNIIFDEVHQVPTTAKFLSHHVTEFRRHRLGLILSCHYLKQFRDLYGALKSSGVSYVIIKGTEKENLEMLKEEMLPFTPEEVEKMPPHHALCIVNYGNQYARFRASLPEF